MRKRKSTTVNYRHMEQMLRGELTGSSVRLSEGQRTGRVHVEIEVEMLRTFFQKAEDHKRGAAWLQEKDELMKEIQGLKAKVNQLQRTVLSEALKGPNPTMTLNSEKKKKERAEALLKQNKQETAEEIESLRAQLKTLKEIQLDTQNKLEQQTSCSAALQVQLDQLEAMNKDLLEERASYKAELEEQNHNNNNLKAALEEAQLQFRTSWVNWEEERQSLRKDKEAMAQTLKNMEQESESSQNQWREEKKTLQQDIEKMRNSLLQKEQESEAASSKWTEIKTELQQDMDCLKTTLLQKEQESEAASRKWTQEKTELQQDMDCLKTTLLQKEQEWKKMEEDFRAQLEKLEAQILKKKKKKWYRRLLSRF